MLRRARSLAVLCFLLAGGIGIISSTQTWVEVTRADAGEQLLVAGADAVALLAPLSLAVLALGAALSIAGLVLRYLFALLGAGGALVLITSTLPVVFDPPVEVVAASVAEATGLSGTSALHEIVASLTPTAWPAVALCAWVVLLAASVFVVATAHSWAAGGKRYRSTAEAHHQSTGPLDAVDSWDELSHGTDPTD
ncbi:Tryptophan-associated membrane protein [Microbacterium esteraromaticum]|uniref:Tryptophan-associated membrane protein n=1 Tax=Microbacterium esteraromaticum TaxID=57043 RepID=A0A1R4ISG1_9MICO|nr:Trp biosynthesis-associated membrane protein [Microbacterium esteraromaticum]SJN22525.1 Tryptophan-associated membrane protein [Microbacterium esteraromaticum]